MAGEELYSLSADLREAVRAAAAKVEYAFPGKARFVEYITLPDYGQHIILRFDWSEEEVSLERADEIESRIRELVGPAYWATLMGSVYHRLGLESGLLEQRLVMIDHELPNWLAQQPQTVHAERLKRDAIAIRKTLALTPDYQVWEVEVPGSEGSEIPEIRIVAPPSGKEMAPAHGHMVRRFGSKDCRVVFLEDSGAFWGCVKAYCAAERDRVALGSFILRFRRDLTDP